MGSANKLETKFGYEFLHLIFSKCPTHSSVRVSPSADVFVWPGPQQICKEAYVSEEEEEEEEEDRYIDSDR